MIMYQVPLGFEHKRKLVGGRYAQLPAQHVREQLQGAIQHDVVDIVHYRVVISLFQVCVKCAVWEMRDNDHVDAIHDRSHHLSILYEQQIFSQVEQSQNTSCTVCSRSDGEQDATTFMLPWLNAFESASRVRIITFLLLLLAAR
jgi:hypothetical protein